VGVPVLVEADSEVAERLGAVLGSGVILLRDVDALRAHLSVDVTEFVVVLGPSVEFAVVTKLARWVRVIYPEVAVILVRREGAASVSTEAWKAGIRDVVNALDHAGLIAAVQRAIPVSDLALRLAREMESGVVTVFAGERGSGTTMVAVRLAGGLARAGRRVCLLDLALGGAEVAGALRLAPERDMGDLLPMADVLDGAAVAGIVTPSAAGFDVVAAPPQPGDSIPPELTGLVLRLLGEAYDHVVIHTPPRFDDHVRGALNLTDVLLLLTRVDFPGLIGLRRAVEGLDRLSYPRERRRIVLVESATDTDVLVTETEKLIGMPFWARIPPSPDVLATGRGKLPSVPADPTDEINEPTGRSAAEPPVGAERQPEDPVTAAFAGGLRSVVHESVIDELGSHLDELRDAYVAVDRAVHSAFDAVLAREQGTVSAADRAAITRDVLDAILRYGSARGLSWVPVRPLSQGDPPQLGQAPHGTVGVRLRAYAENAALTWGLSSHLDIEDQPVRLSHRREEGLLRLGYQAITHACKHAGAHNLWVSLRVSGLTALRIEDDGTGPVSKRRNSYRWRSLTDIATQHDVYLAIQPRPPQGTIIEITAA
jgi:pilus assembly protein CpaE